jgi:hypothetical protein
LDAIGVCLLELPEPKPKEKRNSKQIKAYFIQSINNDRMNFLATMSKLASALEVSISEL